MTPRDSNHATGSGERPAAPPRLGSQAHLFDVPGEIAYFNTANMSPLLRSVREAGERGLARRAAPWRIRSDDWITEVERLRDALAQLVGVDSDGVALVPATSYGLAVAARNLSASATDEVIVLADEYPSNYYTWHRFCHHTGARLVVVEREPGQSWTEAVLARIGERTRLLAVPNVHWTNGALLDLAAVSDAARSVGAALVVDASQSLGALPLDAQVVRPDFIVSVGYKWLLGPFGLGFLYAGEHYRDGEALEENWINRAGSDDFAALTDYTDTYRPGARRFDVGQRTNFGLVPMAIAATEQLLTWTVAGVAETLRELTDDIRQRAATLGFTVPPADQHGPHMLGIEVPREIARALNERLSERGVVASVRGNALRIAPHLHNTAEDLDRLFDALAAT
jgi:selenocysteine lyase/cysteine desulfurase